MLMKSMAAAMLAAIVLAGPAWADPTETVTLYSVRFHQYFQPGSFTAFLDGENVTREFAPAPAPKGTSDMVRNTPFIGGDVIALGGYIGGPQNPVPSLM